VHSALRHVSYPVISTCRRGIIRTSAAAVPRMPGVRFICRARAGLISTPHGVVGNRDLIRVAVARDPRQAMPLTGTWYGRADASLGMSVEVIVRRAYETGTGTAS
jgi:hypothetical protein